MTAAYGDFDRFNSEVERYIQADGTYVSAYGLVVASAAIELSGRTTYTYVSSRDTPLHVLLGLMQLGQRHWNRALDQPPT